MTKLSQAAEELSPKMARMRSRNREHARMTRMRKKAQLESLQAKQAELKKQAECLEQALAGCQTASILVNMNGEASVYANAFLQETMDGNTSESSEGSSQDYRDDEGNASDQPESPQCLSREFVPSAGADVREEGPDGLDGQCKREGMTAEELDRLRRERNRMHAKRTRDRKKLLVLTLQRSISHLENQNQARVSLLTRSLPPHLLDTFVRDFGLNLTWNQ